MADLVTILRSQYEELLEDRHVMFRQASRIEKLEEQLKEAGVKPYDADRSGSDSKA